MPKNFPQVFIKSITCCHKDPRFLPFPDRLRVGNGTYSLPNNFTMSILKRTGQKVAYSQKY